MPTFDVQAPDGTKLRLEGDSDPTESELEEVFSKAAPQPELKDPGVLAGLRMSPVGRALLGPTSAETESMAGGKPGAAVSPADLAQTALKFTSVGLPPVAKAVTAVTDPLLSPLPPVVRGAAKGIREAALNLPLAPMGSGSAGKAALAAFGAEYLHNQPEVLDAFKKALDNGDVEGAAKIATENVAGGVLLGVGAGHSLELRPNVKPLTPDMESARRVAEMSPDEFAKSAQSFNKINLELGKNATPQDVAELTDLRDKAQSRLAEATKKAEADRTDASMNDMAKLSSMPQFFNEAIAAAKQSPEAAPPAAESKPSPATETAAVGAVPSEPVGVGPGAKASGEEPYSAVQQLSDALKVSQPSEIRDSVSSREKLADKLSEGRSIADRVIAKSQAITQSIKDSVRGVRKVQDIDRTVGDLDWVLQKSSAQSKNVGKAIEKQVPSEDVRNAAAIWADAGGDEAAIREAIGQFPEKTPPKIRRAAELATNLPPEGKHLAELFRQFFKIREQDAVQHELFDQGIQDYYTHVWRKESNMPDSLKAAISNGRVNTYFQFARQRKIPTFLEGIIQGKVPELDPAKVIPYYNYAMDRSIGSREFVDRLTKLRMSDGRPGAAPSGIGRVVEQGGTPDALIIKPDAVPKELNGYRSIDHPAMRKWKWGGEGPEGAPVLYQGDLMVHPEIYDRVARMMDRPLLSATKPVAAALRIGAEAKALKLGLLSTFHQMHVGLHAVFHLTDPIRVPEIDWESPTTKYAVEKGHLKLAPNPGELANFAEGLLSPGLVHKIPGIGPVSRAYSEWLFGDYIPRLKLATFQNALKRNLDHYAGDIKSGKVTPEEIAARVGDASNNAYGELNQMFLGKFGRDPRFQRLLRLAFLAPDFGEARLRFIGKALTKYGHEERMALGTMFLTLYGIARLANYSSHGDPEFDIKHAFQIKVGDHWWSMRSVLGDLDHAITDFGHFIRNRLSPLYARPLLEFLQGRNERGEKVGRMDEVKDFAKQLIPIQAGGFTRSDQTVWESFLTAMGLTAQRDSPGADVAKMASAWMEKSQDPKLQEIFQREQKEVYAQSAYQPLRDALRRDNLKQAVEAYQELLKTRKPDLIRRTMMPFTVDNVAGMSLRHDKPFTGSQKREQEFMKTLTPMQLRTYQQAKDEREMVWKRFQQLISTNALH